MENTTTNNSIKTIKTYGDMFDHVFTSSRILNSEDLPEYWEGDVRDNLQENEETRSKLFKNFASDYPTKVANGEIKEEYAEDFDEYEEESIYNLLDGVYVIHQVTGDGLDKLVSYGVHYIPEIDGYIFLRTWFGMSADMVHLKPFEFNTKNYIKKYNGYSNFDTWDVASAIQDTEGINELAKESNNYYDLKHNLENLDIYYTMNGTAFDSKLLDYDELDALLKEIDE